MDDDMAHSARVEWTVRLRVRDADGVEFDWEFTDLVAGTATEAIDAALGACDETVIGLDGVRKSGGGVDD